MKAFDIVTENRISAFLAQIGHESGSLSSISENLNYSASILIRQWPRHFPTEAFAQGYHRQPQKIANRAYANRMGNGTEASGDGWKYRGRGLIQLTGKNNYILLSEYFGEDFVGNPDMLLQPVWCCLSAGWYWETNSLNKLADVNDIIAISKRINGGVNGLQDRIVRYDKAREIFKGFDAIYHEL